MEQVASFEKAEVKLREPIHGLDAIQAVVGIPEWWPSGSRSAAVLSHDAGGDMNDPLIVHLQRELTLRGILAVRFNFPFAEAGKKASSDSPETLQRAFAAAISILGRDPAAAPAHLFVGGKGLGARTAVRMATGRLQAEGVFCLAFPLHPANRPEQVQADDLFRIICPMLFVQGTRDRRCHPDALRRALSRVGAPKRLELIEGADHSLRTPAAQSGPPDTEPDASSLEARIGAIMAPWMQGIVGSP